MIRGRTVTLRRVEPADYPLIQRWQNDPEVFRFMDYVRPFSAEDIRESEERATQEGHPFIIEADGTPVGRIGLNQLRARDAVAALYIFVGERDAWGKGYASDALATLLRYGFDTLGLRMIELWTLADNERAVRMYKKLGFTEDGRLRNRSFKDGRYVDHVVMSITRDEFASRGAGEG